MVKTYQKIPLAGIISSDDYPGITLASMLCKDFPDLILGLFYYVSISIILALNSRSMFLKPFPLLP